MSLDARRWVQTANGCKFRHVDVSLDTRRCMETHGCDFRHTEMSTSSPSTDCPAAFSASRRRKRVRTASWKASEHTALRKNAEAMQLLRCRDDGLSIHPKWRRRWCLKQIIVAVFQRASAFTRSRTTLRSRTELGGGSTTKEQMLTLALSSWRSAILIWRVKKARVGKEVQELRWVLKRKEECLKVLSIYSLDYGLYAHSVFSRLWSIDMFSMRSIDFWLYALYFVLFRLQSVRAFCVQDVRPGRKRNN